MIEIRRAAVLIVVLSGATIVSAQQPAPSVGLIDVVRSAIERHADALLQRQHVNFSGGDALAAAGRFDSVFGTSLQRSRTYQPLLDGQRTGLPANVDAAVQSLTTYGVGFEKEFRSGLFINPSLDMIGTDNDLLLPPGNGRARLAFNLTQPLLRGRGETAVTATERATREVLTSSRHEERFTAARLALNAAVAYWQYVAAEQRLTIAKASEARGRQLVTELEELLRGGRQTAAALKQVQADLANRMARRLNTDQLLIAARYNLGLAAGLTIEEMEALGLPRDDFPEPPTQLGPSWHVNTLMQQALAERSDLDAARSQQRAALALIASAKDAIRPRADLNFTVGVAGLTEGAGAGRYVRPLFEQVRGGDFGVSLSYQWPVANRVAFGQLAKSEATSEQTAIRVAEITRTVGAGVRVAMSNVELGIERLRYVNEAASLYGSAVEDERAKLQLGLSTVLDLVLTEDRFTQSQLDAIEARASYARAIVQLRFETGTLLAATPIPQVDEITLRTLPRR